jgi:hypothetical protein
MVLRLGPLHGSYARQLYVFEMIFGAVVAAVSGISLHCHSDMYASSTARTGTYRCEGSDD